MSSLDINAVRDRLLHRLGLISDVELLRTELHAQVGIECHQNPDETAMQPLRVLKIGAASGVLGGWQDGGWRWHVLKLKDGDKATYMLAGGFDPIFPLPLRDFTSVFANILSDKIKTAYLSLAVSIERDGDDVQFMLREWTKLAESLKDVTTTGAPFPHVPRGRFPVLRIEVEPLAPKAAVATSGSSFLGADAKAAGAVKGSISGKDAAATTATDETKASVAVPARPLLLALDLGHMGDCVPHLSAYLDKLANMQVWAFADCEYKGLGSADKPLSRKRFHYEQVAKPLRSGADVLLMRTVWRILDMSPKACDVIVCSRDATVRTMAEMTGDEGVHKVECCGTWDELRRLLDERVKQVHV